MHRLWTDNITTLTGSNSITINTGNTPSTTTTGDLNLTGAAILSNNITLSIAGNTNKTNLEDSYYSESSSFGVQTTINQGLNRQGQNQTASNLQPTVPGTGGKPDTAPGGATTISLALSENSSNRTTYATIGDLDSKLTSNTSSMLGADFDATLTVDHRLFSESGRASIYQDNTNFKENTKNNFNNLAKTIDAPLKELANSTANIPYIGTATSLIAGEGGSIATLATQLLGLDYILDSGNSRLQYNKIEEIDNETLADAINNKYKIKLDKDLGEGDDVNGRTNTLRIFDNNNNEIGTYKTSTKFKDIDNITLSDLINNKDNSLHGIYNTSDQALLNGLTQLKTIKDQSNNSLNFTTLAAPSKGLILDGAEVFYNFVFGKTPLASANMLDAREYGKELGQSIGTLMQYQNVTTQNNSSNNSNNNVDGNNFITTPIDTSLIRFVGHSGGGDRLQVGVLRGAGGLDLGSDGSGNKILPFAKITGYDSQGAIYTSNVAVQFYGTPSWTSNLGGAAERAGAWMDKVQIGVDKYGNPQYDYSPGHQINPGDPIANIFGANSFLPITKASPIEFGRSIVGFPLLFSNDLSPHSGYLCRGAFCNPNQLQQTIQQNLISKQNSK